MPAPELILHHYDLSPYAEKIRLCFGRKGLEWRSVQIPIVMPKPDLTTLTGGYRRTPTLQLGADIYCDTKVIARALDRLHPEPPLVPAGQETLVTAFSRWAETSFMMVVTIIFGAGGLFDEAFVEDRKKMMPGADPEQAKLVIPAKQMQLRENLVRLDEQLADGRAFLLGQELCLADLAAYHPIGMSRVHPLTGSLLDGLPHLAPWMDRIAAVGHGKRVEMESGDAVAIARDATPAAYEGEVVDPPEGLKVGQSVAILPEEVGSGVVSGELLPSDIHEIRIRHQSERAGELVIHFPREDYLVLPA